MRRLYILFAAFALAGSMMMVGCQNSDNSKPKGDHHADKKGEPHPDHVGDHRADQTGQSDEIKVARAKLSPADRMLVDAQEYCVVQTDSRLGEMGTPIKLMVKDQPVFLCCKGCQKKALADPEKTLATVKELKSNVKAAAEKK